MKLALFRINKEKYVPERLQEEANKAGIKLDIYQYQELLIQFSLKKRSFLLKRIQLDDYDGLIFRVAGTSKGGYIAFRNLLIRKFLEKRKKVLNGFSYLKFPRLDKLIQTYLLAQKDLPVIKTIAFGRDVSFSQINKIITRKIGYPCLIKPRFGSQGRGIVKITDYKGLKKIFSLLQEKGLEMWLFQPFLPSGQDYRFIVLGGQVLGGMKRVAAAEAIVTNFSQGGKIFNHQPTKEEKELALKAAQIFNLNYVGIDIIYDKNGKPYILEVNRACQFRGFETATGLNVAEKIINWFKK